jgi:hypothetical protein
VTGCHQIYATARAAMVAHIDTMITAEDFIRPHR